VTENQGTRYSARTLVLVNTTPNPDGRSAYAPSVIRFRHWYWFLLRSY